MKVFVYRHQGELTSYTKSWNVGHQFKSKVSHISGQLWTRCFRAFQGVPGVPMPTRTNPKCPETNQGQSGPTRIDQDQPGPDKSKLGNWHSVLKCGTLSWNVGHYPEMWDAFSNWCFHLLNESQMWDTLQTTPSHSTVMLGHTWTYMDVGWPIALLNVTNCY